VDPAREWSFFVAGTFALMGGSLIAAAERRAADAVVWENERRRHAGAEPVACDGPFLTAQRRLNQGFGAALLVLGALVGAGLLERLSRWRPSGPAAFVLGAALVLLAFAGVAAHLLGRRPVPRFVQDAVGGPAAPLAERASEVLSWALRAWWLVYGGRLLWSLRG